MSLPNVSHEAESLPANIQAQIEQRLAGKRKKVFHGGCLCSKCMEPKDPGPDYYCKLCRNSYSAQKKRDDRAELKRLRIIARESNSVIETITPRS